MNGLWTAVTVLGPLLLAAVLAYAVFRNRTSSARKARTEDATRDLYQRTDAEDRRRDNP